MIWRRWCLSWVLKCMQDTCHLKGENGVDMEFIWSDYQGRLVCWDLKALRLLLYRVSIELVEDGKGVWFDTEKSFKRLMNS